MKGKELFSIIGMVVSAMIVITGILTICGIFGGNESYIPYYYDSGYASFGADFYSYVNNNAAAAASDMTSLVLFTKSISGIFMICFGLLSLCHFGMAHSECVSGQKKNCRKPLPEAYQPYTPPTEPEVPNAVTDEETAASCDSSDNN